MGMGLVSTGNRTKTHINPVLFFYMIMSLHSRDRIRALPFRKLWHQTGKKLWHMFAGGLPAYALQGGAARRPPRHLAVAPAAVPAVALTAPAPASPLGERTPPRSGRGGDRRGRACWALGRHLRAGSRRRREGCSALSRAASGRRARPASSRRRRRRDHRCRCCGSAASAAHRDRGPSLNSRQALSQARSRPACR